MGFLGGRWPLAKKPIHFCKHAGCNNLTSDSFCPLHLSDQKTKERIEDKRRGSARQRGYTTRWNKYSKWFLSLPDNQFCKLHLDEGCAGIAQCVDHIVPPSSADDPLFWDTGNHQAACIHCNSVKGKKIIKGNFDFK